MAAHGVQVEGRVAEEGREGDVLLDEAPLLRREQRLGGRTPQHGEQLLIVGDLRGEAADHLHLLLAQRVDEGLHVIPVLQQINHDAEAPDDVDVHIAHAGQRDVAAKPLAVEAELTHVEHRAVKAGRLE